MYEAKKHTTISIVSDAIETALHHERQHDPQGANTYALLALALQANERRYQTIPATGWVLLERDIFTQEDPEVLLVHHVLAFQEFVSQDGEERDDLRAVVWLTGEGRAVAYDHEHLMLVRGVAACGAWADARTFAEIADAGATDAERDWMISRYPMLQKPSS